jgi:hypothetical protein
MQLYDVKDMDLQNVGQYHYDLAMFASGYEERCTAIPKLFNPSQIENAVVIGFTEENADQQRVINDKYFIANWVEKISISSSNDDREIYNILNTIFENSSNRKTIHILVDYSSMSRLWYAGVLNWAKFFSKADELRIDMLYAPGVHREKISPMVINDILSIPGCEGSATSLFQSIAVFGLGFDSYAALCVLDRIEPDYYYTYLASPTIFPDYPEIVMKKNDDIIRSARNTLSLPLFSVEQTYNALGEIVSLHKDEADIIFVPMGPKPHVLASILLAMKFREITCLRVSSSDGSKTNIKAAEHVVGSRIFFRP